VSLDNMFVARLRAEIPDSIRSLTDGLKGKQVEELDMSDNAFGPDGIRGFSGFLETCLPCLAVLKVNNCGISPLGGEMIAAALRSNPHLQLRHFEAGRDRLECDGISALSKFFSKAS